MSTARQTSSRSLAKISQIGSMQGRSKKDGIEIRACQQKGLCPRSRICNGLHNKIIDQVSFLFGLYVIFFKYHSFIQVRSHITLWTNEISQADKYKRDLHSSTTCTPSWLACACTSTLVPTWSNTTFSRSASLAVMMVVKSTSVAPYVILLGIAFAFLITCKEAYLELRQHHYYGPP